MLLWELINAYIFINKLYLIKIIVPKLPYYEIEFKNPHLHLLTFSIGLLCLSKFC